MDHMEPSEQGPNAPCGSVPAPGTVDGAQWVLSNPHCVRMNDSMLLKRQRRTRLSAEVGPGLRCHMAPSEALKQDDSHKCHMAPSAGDETQ
jgi:hypothetical protein